MTDWGKIADDVDMGVIPSHGVHLEVKESVREAMFGCMTASEYLHEYLIPQWEYIVRRNSVEVYKPVPTDGAEYAASKIIKATSASTSLAWAVAILRAKQSEVEE
jgi:hypothetical protein